MSRTSVDAQRLEIVLTKRRKGNVAVGKCGDLRAVRGMYGVAGSIVDDGTLDVSDVLHTEQRHLSRRHMASSFGFVHLFSRLCSENSRLRRARAARLKIRARLDLYSPHSALNLGAH